MKQSSNLAHANTYTLNQLRVRPVSDRHLFFFGVDDSFTWFREKEKRKRQRRELRIPHSHADVKGRESKHPLTAQKVWTKIDNLIALASPTTLK